MKHILNDFIRSRTPRFNRMVVEGYMHHRMRYAVEYLDEYLQYTCSGKTQTHLEYIGYELITPEEELSLSTDKKSSQRPLIDVSRSDVYVVRVNFEYAKRDRLTCNVHLPWIEKGNIWFLNGARYLVSPVLADKVISVGRNGIFVNVTTAKYNFERTHHHLYVDEIAKVVSVVTTELYKNQAKKLEPTTKAKPTNMHYLLCAWGYSETMKRLLGFVPEVHLGAVKQRSKDRVYYESFGIPPHGYLKTAGPYVVTPLSFSVSVEQANETTQYVLGNLFYVIDHFSERVLKSDLDKPTLWVHHMGAVIHSGNFPITYLMEKMTAHFKDLQSTLDRMTQMKLKQVGVEASNLIELLAVIFEKYNEWSVQPDTTSLYGRKTLETELFALSRVTSMFVRFVLDITKEELRNNGEPLEPNVVTGFVNSHLRRRPIYKLREENTFVQTAGDTEGPSLSSTDIGGIGSETKPEERQEEDEGTQFSQQG